MSILLLTISANVFKILSKERVKEHKADLKIKDFWSEFIKIKSPWGYVCPEAFKMLGGKVDYGLTNVIDYWL
jgi:hypothetical protein